MRALCVSIHDVAPATWAACRTLMAAIAEVDPRLPLTLLVVPDYHALGHGVPAGYRAWLNHRISAGDEIALHGYTHRDEAPPAAGMSDALRRRFYTAGEGEFAALSREAALRKLAAADGWCATQGWRAHGFVAPAWLMSRGTWDALSAFDFQYTTTLGRFHLLREGRSIRAPSLVYSARSPWRRWMSQQWNDVLSGAVREAPLVRLGLHPADAQHPELVAHAQRVLDRMRWGRTGMTKIEYAQLARKL